MYRGGSKDAAITLVTSIDNRVATYAPYSAALLELYALRNNYSFLLYCQDSSIDEDGRWTKVRIMKDLVHTHLYQETHKHTHTDIQTEMQTPGQTEGITYPSAKYLMWIDVDMIFLNLTYTIPPLLHPTPQGDMWVSAEMHGGSGVANTGGFVLKVSEYASLLLAAWWASDHAAGHDQTLFDLLYRRLLPDIQQHVVILPVTALNSPSPSYLHHHVSYPLLHLMGERNVVRARVFAHVLSSVCAAGVDTIQHINLTRALLGQLTLDSNMEALVELNVSMHHVLDSNAFNWGVYVGYVADYRELLLSIHRIYTSSPYPYPYTVSKSSEYKHAHLNMTEQFVYLYDMLLCHTRFEGYLHVHHVHLQHLSCEHISKQHAYTHVLAHTHDMPIAGAHDVVQVVYTLAMLANDLMSEMVRTMLPTPSLLPTPYTYPTHTPSPLPSQTQLNVLETMYTDVHALLAYLLSLVGENSKVLVLENQGMLYFNQAEFYVKLCVIPVNSRNQCVADAIGAYMRSLEVYQQEIPPAKQNRYHHIAPLLSLAALLCESNLGADGIAYYRQLVGLLEDLLSAEKQFKTEHESYLLALQGAMRCEQRMQRGDGSGYDEHNAAYSNHPTWQRKVDYIYQLRAGRSGDGAVISDLVVSEDYGVDTANPTNFNLDADQDVASYNSADKGVTSVSGYDGGTTLARQSVKRKVHLRKKIKRNAQ
ncbi:hypothetical protein EON63_05080 [archaeon]|nr:MAG: hypothetical protein EON63_05080 [archaeon]